MRAGLEGDLYDHAQSRGVETLPIPALPFEWPCSWCLFLMGSFLVYSIASECAGQCGMSMAVVGVDSLSRTWKSEFQSEVDQIGRALMQLLIAARIGCSYLRVLLRNRPMAIYGVVSDDSVKRQLAPVPPWGCVIVSSSAPIGFISLLA